LPARRSWFLLAAGSLLLALVAWDFAAATTFLGDDYLFRCFARFEPNPWSAFDADKHGGEYYRPVPMAVWWLLERLSGGRVWPFAALAFTLHALCSLLVTTVGRRVGLSVRAARLAGLLFLAAPAEREAALWFSASTDLLAAVAVLGAVALGLSGSRLARGASVALATVGFFCKETALVLPLLLGAAAWFRARNREQPLAIRGSLAGLPYLAFLPYLAAIALYLLVRTVVLHGVGGANDPLAPWWGRVLQIGAGLVHAVTGYAPLPEWAAWLVGVASLAWSLVAARRRNRWADFALAWVIITLLPLPAAGWVVGARYFYLPAAGLVLLGAMALEAQRWAALLPLMFFLGLGALSGRQRANDIRLYRSAVAAADQAISQGVAQGHRLFLVRGAVKDLDLAFKLAPHRSSAETAALVIPDVPASFVWLPLDLAQRAHFLVAEPPLPPSGAYHFGREQIVGLARRDDAPDLEEVFLRLPELRMIRLYPDGAKFAWRDVTDDFTQPDY
jgi:hypothetical protein